MITPAQFNFIDIENCFSTEPPPLDFVLPGFLAGTVGGLVSPGGVGKSTFALELCIAVACSVDAAGEPC
jgi:RecA-family ATPase